MKTIAIIAASFYGNRGAEAMLSTCIGMLSETDRQLHFNVYSYYPDMDADLVQDQRITIHSSTPARLVMELMPGALLFRLLDRLGWHGLQARLPSSVRALAASRALICLAGVSFIDGRERFLPFNIATLWPAMILGVPVFKFPQAMGPFDRPLNRLAARYFLGRCRKIFTRGARTHQHVTSLLPEAGSAERADDVALLFRPEFCISRPAPGLQQGLDTLERLGREQGGLLIGICPSAVMATRAKASGRDHAQGIRRMIGACVERGHVVALYPNATRGAHRHKTHNNDLPLLEAIIRDLDPKCLARTVCFDESLNAAQIQQIVAACDVHLVSRFHAMIAALAASRPVMVMGWSHKYLEVMEAFDQADMVLDDGPGQEEKLLTCLDRLIGERALRAARIKCALPARRARAQRAFEVLSAFLDDAP